MPANETVTELLPNDVLRKKGTKKIASEKLKGRRREKTWFKQGKSYR